MPADNRILTIGVAASLVWGLVSCAAPRTPPASTISSSPPPTSTGTTASPVEPSPAPSATPTPSPTRAAQPSADQTIALYAAGSREQARLYTLAADGAIQDLNRDVYPRSTASRDGQWVAGPDSQLPAQAVVVTDLEANTTYTVPVRPGSDPQGMAFDPTGSRLTFLELGAPAADGTPWAIVMVRLEDGSTTRFEAMTGPNNTLLPGSPIGWHEDELLLDTFVPGSEAGSAGVWAISLPAAWESGSIDSLDRRQVLRDDDYLFTPHLSRDGNRLLYLNRDYQYTPDGYEPISYDLAVNQLGLLNLVSGGFTLLVEETEGDALGKDVAWSPDGTLGLFARGDYAGDIFASLSLRTIDDTGMVQDVAPVPLPSDGSLVSLDWCAQDTALVVVETEEAVHQLHRIDLAGGQSSRLISDDYVAMLGCVTRGRPRAGNADVVHVRAVRTAGSMGSGPSTWTFYVTVEHPDTGWEDYADGWDVVTPDGEVLKPDLEAAFTRVLFHPHVDEQPFTRSQTGIAIPEGVTTVSVRAHDIVDGYGGKEVVVDLTHASGPAFEVELE